MSRRTPGGDDRIQDPAGAMGQGTDPDRQEDTAPGVAKRCPLAHQDRSLVPPDGQYQLSPHDHAVGVIAPGHDHPLLPGLVPDAVHRPALVPGFDILDLQFLSGLPARVISAQLAPRSAVLAHLNGARNRPDHHQYEGRHRGSDRKAERVCAHAQISRHYQAG